MEEAPRQRRKTLSVSEANALLPDVTRLVQQLQGLQQSIVQTNRQLDDVIGKLASGNGFPIQSLKDQIQALTRHQLQLIEAFQSALKQLEDLGGVLKDLNMGLVDFYSLRQDKTVFLCWTLGEERIGFWHTLEEGLSGRHPLDTPA